MIKLVNTSRALQIIRLSVWIFRRSWLRSLCAKKIISLLWCHRSPLAQLCKWKRISAYLLGRLLHKICADFLQAENRPQEAKGGSTLFSGLFCFASGGAATLLVRDEVPAWRPAPPSIWSLYRPVDITLYDLLYADEIYPANQWGPTPPRGLPREF